MPTLAEPCDHELAGVRWLACEREKGHGGPHQLEVKPAPAARGPVPTTDGELVGQQYKTHTFIVWSESRETDA